MLENSNIDVYESARQAMVEEQLRRRGIHDQRVLAAMQSVPRHEFIPRKAWHDAYKDNPVPIGEGQTISQPYIVAVMVQHLYLQPSDLVLEVGTGTGYQAAVLAHLAAEVVTIERQPRLAEQARWNFERVGYKNIRVILGDGTAGAPALAPFQGIIVAAAAPSIPSALVEQLAEQGRMVIPVGSRETQTLKLLRKINGRIETSDLEAVRFVPLLGEKAFPERDF